MTMLTPAYKLTVGSQVVDTTKDARASTVVALTVALDLDAPADSTRLVLGQVGFFKPGQGDTVAVELGYADNGGTTQVFTGTVKYVSPTLTTVDVIALSGASALLEKRVNQTYLDHTAGEIVSDLADQAKITVATADDGVQLPAYVVDGRRSVYAHMRELAGWSGVDLYIDAQGELVFQRFNGGNVVHALEYGKHIVALDIARTPARAGQVEVWGESPIGSEGSDAWAWLTPDFSGSKGASGSGAKILLQYPALRTHDAAQLAAASALTTIQHRTIRGRVETWGRQDITLGDAIALQGLADSALNTQYQVRGVTHRIGKRRGFTTVVEFRSVAT